MLLLLAHLLNVRTTKGLWAIHRAFHYVLMGCWRISLVCHRRVQGSCEEKASWVNL